MNLGRQIILLVLGTVVLVGCQQAATTAERQRWAGEMDTVKSATGLMKMSCVAAIAKSKENPESSDFAKCLITSGTKAKAVTDTGLTAQQARGRMFYSETTLTYLYLGYLYYDANYSSSYSNNNNYNYNYNNTNTSTSSYTDNSQLLCKLLFGRKCWRNDWYSTYFGYQPQTTAQHYNPSCNSWLNTGYSAQYSSDYQNLGNSFSYNPSQQWNNSWSSCYNVYY